MYLIEEMKNDDVSKCERHTTQGCLTLDANTKARE